MTLSRLSSTCKTCPYVDSCDHKQMEMVGFLEPTAATAQSNLQESLITSHDYRQITVAPHTTVTIDIEEIKKEVEKSIAKHAGLYGGFFQNCT